MRRELRLMEDIVGLQTKPHLEGGKGVGHCSVVVRRGDCRREYLHPSPQLPKGTPRLENTLQRYHYVSLYGAPQRIRLPVDTAVCGAVWVGDLIEGPSLTP